MITGLLSGCSKAPSSAKDNTLGHAPKPAGKTKFLSIGTAPPGGAFFVVGGALGEVLNAHKNKADNNWNVTAEATMGTQENIRRLVKGELDLGMANAAITYFAVRGQGEWAQAQPVQAVLTLAPNVAFFITPAKTGIKTITELRGKRVVLGPPGAWFEYFVRPILEAHGITLADITPLYATQTAAVDMLTDGSAAAAFLGGAVPTASITQACAGEPMFFIPFAEQAKSKLLAEYPFFQPAKVPANTYRGQTEPFEGLNVGSMHLITASAMDEATIYRITQALYDNREEVATKHPAGKSINPNNAARHVGTAFHPGAIRFYKEIGIWKD